MQFGSQFEAILQIFVRILKIVSKIAIPKILMIKGIRKIILLMQYRAITLKLSHL